MSRATILVVDDVPENLGLLLDALGMEGLRGWSRKAGRAPWPSWTMRFRI